MKDNKNGQVGIIVAILVISLFVAVIVIIQVYYVPEWMKDKEADHMDVVANQFANLKFSIDLQTMTESDSSITNSLTLGSKELPYFMSSRAFGSLQILPSSTSNFRVSVTPLSGRVGEIYQPSAASSGEINYVTHVSKLDLHIDGFSGGEMFNLSINGIKYLEVRVTSTGYRIVLKTINSTQILFNQTIASDIPTQEEFIINLLNSDYKFSTDVLPYIPTPYNISFNGSSNGDFTIKCTKFGDSSSSTIQHPLGAINYQSENAYFVDQTYMYQGGSVILSQASGEAVISSPSFSATNYTTMHVFNISVVDIREVPGKTSVSGYGTYSVRTNYSTSSYSSMIARGINITISTEYTSAWKRYFENFLNASALTNFTVVENESQNYVVVAINGPKGGNAYDVKLSLSKIAVYAQIGPGWVS